MKKFSYKQFLVELEKEIDYVQGEIRKDYDRDIAYYRNQISEVNDNQELINATENMHSLLKGITGSEEDKRYTMEFFGRPEAKKFVNYDRDDNESIGLLFVMAMIKHFVDDVVCFQTLNVNYWMVEDDSFFEKVVRRSFVKEESMEV